MTVSWSAELSVGSEQLDQHHQEIIRHVVEVQERVEAADDAGAARALSSLAESVVRHFAAEEELMDRWLYPERAAHKGAHLLFVQDLLALVQEQAEAGLTEDVVEWARGRMPEWITFHIQINDAPLGRYLAGRQARPGPRPSPTAKPTEA
jgi:hemerythrin